LKGQIIGLGPTRSQHYKQRGTRATAESQVDVMKYVLSIFFMNIKQKI